MDPVYVANEGIFVAIVSPDIASMALAKLRDNAKCLMAEIIGIVTSDYPKKVIMKSGIGGKRVVPMLIGEQLPRIC
jgi:hydrogenase expression/formation protein HypE